ncbi:MAG: HAD family phosphatase [Patescibacteria group bacterium]|jgi:HAD superfamily hydrolase (TIGR01509 family)
MLFKKVKNDKIKNMIKAVFFDLDDTLVDSLSLHLKANRFAFEKFGYNYNLIQDKTKNIDFMGRRVSDILVIKRDAFGINEKELPAKKLIETRENFFLEQVKKETIMLPGAISLLKTLRGKKIITAIVSSGSKKYIIEVLNKFKLKKLVDFIISGDEVEKGKPEPECYQKAFKYLNDSYGKFDKRECLVVEDTENGVIAANKSHLKVLLVPSKHSVLPKKVEPDYQIRTLKDFDIFKY